MYHMIGKNHLLYIYAYDKGRGIKMKKGVCKQRDLMYEVYFKKVF